ncbi:hypothetical protein U1Q18_004865 [Sarracenia purpurea var. burkii]
MKGLVAPQIHQNPIVQLQTKFKELEDAFKELEGGFKAWLAKPVEATVAIATSAAQGATIGAFMGTLTNVSSSFPTSPLNVVASLNPQALSSIKQVQVLPSSALTIFDFDSPFVR